MLAAFPKIILVLGAGGGIPDTVENVHQRKLPVHVVPVVFFSLLMSRGFSDDKLQIIQAYLLHRQSTSLSSGLDLRDDTVYWQIIFIRFEYHS